MTDLNSIIERIKKLLALSKSSNLHESQAALNKANKLIEEYRLSEAELDADKADPVVRDLNPVYTSARRTQWKSELVMILSHHYGCEVFNNSVGRNSAYILFGRQSDIDIVRYMISWLMLEAERLAHNQSKSRQFDRSGGKIFCASYCLGFVRGLSEQLKKSSDEANEGASSVAIVAINSRLQESKDYVKIIYPKSKKSAPLNKGHYSNNAYLNGKEKGKNIHLGASLNKASGVKLLGS